MTEVTTRRRRAAEATPTDDIIAVLLQLEQQKAENAISKRLHLAGMAMQALIANGGGYATDIAHQSLQMADTMLEAASGKAQG